MGSWSVDGISARDFPLNTATEFGTNWHVTFRMKYTPSLVGPFVETPKLEWNEFIIYIDREKGEYWEFRGNFYLRKPSSPTMEVWAQRYYRAYLAAHNLPFSPWNYQAKGYSRLYDKHNNYVPGNVLGTHNGIDKQIKAVQDYLKKHGGVLEIQVHDIPNVLKKTGGPNKSVERLLTFDIGVTGMGARARAWQFIRMDKRQPESNWHYQFAFGGSPPGLRLTGLRRVADNTPNDPNTLPVGGIL